ncbi:hypothetical protein KIH31_13975 [Paenarthrobacter sp. DKR-5]|uniref:hypothetical protein n=1 Tax=Paenarthrobacter sp. DKR-5 TaxID=2835535 RepID=UPI001BDD1798|nr:hypothetical protein [Paenarthrobacter sp. DKR-5]MBT1003709.1 hypothetical protein [Paenarthrobacter sp. DKR-5]
MDYKEAAGATLISDGRRLIRPGEPFTAGELRAMALDGVVRQVIRDAYLRAGTGATPALRAQAVASAIPAAAAARTVIGRLSAAWVYGCAPPPPRVALLVDHGRRISALRPFSGCTLHEASLGRFDVVMLGSVPVTSPLRTAVDLALHVMPEQSVPALQRLTADPALNCPADLVRRAVLSWPRVPGRRAALDRLEAVRRPGAP